MTKIPSEIFREYDIRGDAERDLTDENVLAIPNTAQREARGRRR